jgi:hypothetical protein
LSPLPPLLGDPHPRHLDRLPAHGHALGCRGREAGAYRLDHLLDREAVRDHQRLGAARSAAASEQLEGTATVRLGPAAVGHGRGRGTQHGHSRHMLAQRLRLGEPN